MAESSIRQVLSGGGILAAASLVAKIGMFIWALMLARILGVEEFGRISVGLAMVAVLQILADTGVSLYLTREVAGKGIARTLPAVRAAWGLEAILVPVVILVALLLSQLDNVSLSRFLWPIVVAVCLAGPLQITRGLLRGQQLFGWDGLVQLAPVAITLVGTALAAGGLSAQTALWIFVCAQAPAALVYSAVIGVRAQFEHQNRDPVTPLMLLKDTWRFNLFGTLAALFNRLDVLMLGWIGVLADVAHYSLGAQFFYGASTLCGAMALAILPSFAREIPSMDQAQARHRYGALLRLFAVLGVVVGMATLGVAPWIGLMLGSDYEGATPLVIVMGFGLMLTVPGYVPGQVLIALGRPGVLVRSFAVAILAAVIAFPVAYLAVGVVGVAVAMVAIWAGMTLSQHLAVRGVL